MPGELDRVRRHAGDAVRRNLGSRAAREAAGRRLDRVARAAVRRMRRAMLTAVVLLGALIAYSITVSPIDDLTWLVAIPTVLLAALLVLVWPSRGRGPEPRFGGAAAVRLDRLGVRAADWLLDRSRFLPPTAAPALDRIVDRLRDLQPALAGLSPNAPTGGDAERLIGRHLPNLVDTYLALPPPERPSGSANQHHLAASLAIVADELDDLCARIDCERRIGFDTERRFLESRYRDGVSLDKPG